MSNLYALPEAVPYGYDHVLAAGVANPGIVRVSDFAREFVWDMKQAPGGAGENMTFKGLKNVEFQLDFQLIGDAQLEEWSSWVTLWDWDPVKGDATPVDVMHPLLYERGVSVATAKKIHAPRQSRPGDNLWIAKIECVEWKPPPKKNVSSSPTGVQAGAQGQSQGGQPTALTARQQEIQRLTQQFAQA